MIMEDRIKMEELSDKYDTLRRGLCAKMRRLAKAVGKEEIY